MNHLSEEDLVLIYYGEPGVAPEAREHLANCGECTAAADSLAQTLNLCNELTVPEPDVDFERRVWPQQVRVWTIPHIWIGVAAAVMVLVSAFLLGRSSRVPEPPVLAGLSDQARQRILEISLADHLDRAGMVLTEISNTGDFATQRSRAEDLVGEGRLFRQTLAQRGESATLAFFDEIQRFLIEVANASPGDYRELQQRMGDGSLLFKVRIMESNLRTQGQKL
jgi:hypothetical protein